VPALLLLELQEATSNTQVTAATEQWSRRRGG